MHIGTPVRNTTNLVKDETKLKAEIEQLDLYNDEHQEDTEHDFMGKSGTVFASSKVMRHNTLPREGYRHSQKLINLPKHPWNKTYCPTLLSRKAWTSQQTNVASGYYVQTEGKTLHHRQRITGTYEKAITKICLQEHMKVIQSNDD